MSVPKTLLSMAGADLAPSALDESVLVLIDCQNEYVTGKLPLVGVDAALDEITILLSRARAAGTPILHVAHLGRPGGLFDPEAEGGRIHAKAAPSDGETVVTKGLPNSFAGTTLQAEIDRTGRSKLILAGFQTHMCVSATARAALDLGYRSKVVASAAATRDLPGIAGGVVRAQALHDAELAALADRFAVIAPTAGDVPDKAASAG
jgi:nicotinamidase-related amidase